MWQHEPRIGAHRHAFYFDDEFENLRLVFVGDRQQLPLVPQEPGRLEVIEPVDGQRVNEFELDLARECHRVRQNIDGRWALRVGAGGVRRLGARLRPWLARLRPWLASLWP